MPLRHDPTPRRIRLPHLGRSALRLSVVVTLAALLAPVSSADRKALHNEIRAADATPTEAWKKPPAGAKPARGGTAVISFLQDIDAINPYVSSSLSASEVQELVFLRLYTEEADYYNGPPTFTPSLAEALPTRGEDKKSLHFMLRDCVWSDGTPITGHDVAFSVEAGKNVDVAWVGRSIVDQIVAVEVDATNPRKFTVRYAKDYPYQLMDINDAMVIPKHSFGKVPFEKWQTHGQWLEQAKTAAGGPFKLSEHKPNQEITLVRNDKYWGAPKPYLDKVVFRIFGEQQAMFTALLAGDVDVMDSVLPKDVSRIAKAKHLELYSHMSRVFGYIGWNCSTFPFDDYRVRQAMTYAIDRENIVDAAFYGYAKVAGPNIISSFWASKADLVPYEYDPDKAEELLREAGWKKNGDGIYAKDGKPLEFTMVTNTGNNVRKQIAEFAQSDLAEIGVKVNIEMKDFNLMSTQLKRHAYKSWVAGWGVATKVDPKAMWHSSAANKGYNYCDYKNPRVDVIVEEGRGLPEFEKARPLWHEFQDILYRDQPYTMVYERRGLVGISKKFTNVKVTSLRYLRNVHEWWIQP